MDDGFDFSELSAFTQHLVDLAQEQFPKEMKQFLRKQGSELNKQTKALARERVGKKGKGGSDKPTDKRYLTGFKRGKAYKHEASNSFAIRVYNTRPHAHLIEYGHVMLDHDKKPVQNGERFVKGKFVLRDASRAFRQQFEENIEEFVDEMLTKGLRL